MSRYVCILDAGRYKPGDQPPDGYVQWHEWAAVQMKAGLRQTRCTSCGKWRFPQELKNQRCHGSEIIPCKVTP